MLFLGTSKYPGEKEYSDFISQNGGSANAYTDMEDTNYYFSVTSSSGEALGGALDRLAQFFIEPTFDQNMVDREIRAIDSEYRNGLTSDQWRNFAMLKSSAAPDHPFTKFGCGNFDTLTQGGAIVNATYAENIGSLPVDDLLQFWKDYYQTYNLRLCVAGRTSLDELQKTVEETFGNLPFSEGKPRRRNRDQSQKFQLEGAQYGVKAFGPNELGKIRHVLPIAESRALKIFFACPPLNDPLLKESKPQRVLSHLIGHEAPGSLHAVLNEDGLITGLSSGSKCRRWIVIHIQSVVYLCSDFRCFLFHCSWC